MTESTQTQDSVCKDLSPTGKQVFELLNRIDPYTAFSNGLDEYAGKLFTHSPEEMTRINKELLALEVQVTDPVEKGFLAFIRTKLAFDEPYMAAGAGIWSIYSHLVKEGVVLKHMVPLLRDIISNLQNALVRNRGKQYSTEVKIITTNQCNGLRGILKVVDEELGQLKEDTKEAKKLLEELRAFITKYAKEFHVEGIVGGDFSEVYPILKEHGGDIGRKHIYPDILRDMYAYPETPNEIEEKGLRWLKAELPILRETAKKLAQIYHCGDTVEEVSKAISEKQSVPKSEVLEFMRSFRKVIHGVANKYLVRVNPAYDTRLLETPPYLVSFIPSAAMNPFDLFTDKPFNIFFVTTDEKRSPPAGYADLFQLIVHEEYGHCVNFSNSSMCFTASPTALENQPTTLSLPVSDGISFFRELESLKLLKVLVRAQGMPLGKEEKAFLDYLKGMGDLDQVLLEVEFVVYKWRIMRFLRAIGDVRINMHKQSVAEFVDWAHQETGLSKNMVFNQIFNFQAHVGYAPCYSMAGEELRAIQKEAILRGVDVVDFNTYASSLGFPPRTIFEERLRQYKGRS